MRRTYDSSPVFSMMAPIQPRSFLLERSPGKKVASHHLLVFQFSCQKLGIIQARKETETHHLFSRVVSTCQVFTFVYILYQWTREKQTVDSMDLWKNFRALLLVIQYVFQGVVAVGNHLLFFLLEHSWKEQGNRFSFYTI